MVKKECEDLKIPFFLLNSSPKELANFVTDNEIGGVVCDFYPLRYPKKLIESFLEHLPKDIPVVQVSIYFIFNELIILSALKEHEYLPLFMFE